jgi:hypothetical protein
MWYASRVFENNPIYVLAFYRSKLNRQHVIQVFFKNHLLNKKLNLTKLLLFNI